MNAQQFLTWMRSVKTPSENPGPTPREESAQLDALLDAFPYFQSAHLLYIKNLHSQGSFLYNNQLKTAAAYAVNRKVLYDLIKQSAVGQSVRLQSDSLQSNPDARSDKTSSSEKVETVDKVPEPIKFPPKKFTSDPDEWEAGMLRQLQLLHHWKQKGEWREENGEKSARQEIAAPKQEEPAIETPAAKEEINTLLYVLVEPGQSEDLSEETVDEQEAETTSEESESTSWEITSAEEKIETPVQIPTDPVQQEILVEAIHSTFELEVDDKLPSVDDLKNVRTEPVTEPVDKKPEATPVAEETLVTSFENMSFSDWLKEVNKKVPAPLPKTILSEDKLIEKFIQEEPRLNVKKSGFYNPVNMAKKSVQESDEFITETLARIYAKQGNHTKAIRAYQKLSLKFPEKTAYFAALIEEIKRTPNK